jgi:hypothetical protein
VPTPHRFLNATHQLGGQHVQPLLFHVYGLMQQVRLDFPALLNDGRHVHGLVSRYHPPEVSLQHDVLERLQVLLYLRL